MLQKMVEMVKEVNDIPAAIGFGISTPEQAKKVASVSDGAIVGSAIVKNCGEVRKRMYSGSRKICERDESGSGDLNVQMNRIPRRARKSAFLGIVSFAHLKKPAQRLCKTPRFFSTSSVQITLSHFLIHSFAFCISFSSILPNGFTEITSVASAFAAG